MRIFAGAAMGLAVVGLAATASASALAAAQDARSCHLCLESAARQTFCADPNKSGFDFDCLCSGPGYVDITRGCSDFCADTEYGILSQCPANHGAVKRDAQNCHLCLEAAARQTSCENNDPNKPGFDFDCLCHGPGYVDITRGCANLCADTELSVQSQCPTKLTGRGPRECTLCLESAARQTSCENNDPNKPGFDFDCLCAESSSSVTRGCANFCAETDFAISAQCPTDNKRAVSAGSPRECSLCLESAARQTHCENNDPFNPGFNFDCLCAEPSSSVTRGCTGFCADTDLAIASQCPADTKRAISVGSPRECTLCLEAASAKTSCANPNTSGFDFDCLCQPSLFDEVSGCTAFCASTPNDLNSQCSAARLDSTSTSTQSSPTLPPRDNIFQTQTMSPRFGFCGPKGVNCKSTEHARQVTTTAVAAITKTTDNLGLFFKRHANITKTVDNLAFNATSVVELLRGLNGTANSTSSASVSAPTSFTLNSTASAAASGVASATEAVIQSTTTPLPSGPLSEGGASAVTVIGKGIFALMAAGVAFAVVV